MADTLIVTATLGNRNSISKTIESVKNIGGDRIQHVLVSPKGLCKSLQNRFPHCIVIPEPEGHKGIYSALNYGLKKYANKFKYLTFINDDDYWLPNFSRLFALLDKEQNTDVAYGRVIYVNAKGNNMGEQTSSHRYKAFKSLLSREIVLFTQQATLMRSELFLNLGGFDESFKLVADSYFWIKAIENQAKFKYINTLCAAYTIQDCQLSSDKKLQRKEHNLIFQKIENPTKIDIVINVIHFRLSNLSVYIKRLLKTGNIVSKSHGN